MVKEYRFSDFQRLAIDAKAAGKRVPAYIRHGKQLGLTLDEVIDAAHSGSKLETAGKHKVQMRLLRRIGNAAVTLAALYCASSAPTTRQPSAEELRALRENRVYLVWYQSQKENLETNMRRYQWLANDEEAHLALAGYDFAIEYYSGRQ